MEVDGKPIPDAPCMEYLPTNFWVIFERDNVGIHIPSPRFAYGLYHLFWRSLCIRWKPPSLNVVQNPTTWSYLDEEKSAMDAGFPFNRGCENLLSRSDWSTRKAGLCAALRVPWFRSMRFGGRRVWMEGLRAFGTKSPIVLISFVGRYTRTIWFACGKQFQMNFKWGFHDRPSWRIQYNPMIVHWFQSLLPNSFPKYTGTHVYSIKCICRCLCRCMMLYDCIDLRIVL